MFWQLLFSSRDLSVLFESYISISLAPNYLSSVLQGCFVVNSKFPIAMGWTTSPLLQKGSQYTAKLQEITEYFLLAEVLQGPVSTKIPSTSLITSSKWDSMDAGSDLAVTTNWKAGLCTFTVWHCICTVWHMYLYFWHASSPILNFFHNQYVGIDSHILKKNLKLWRIVWSNECLFLPLKCTSLMTWKKNINMSLQRSYDDQVIEAKT